MTGANGFSVEFFKGILGRVKMELDKGKDHPQSNESGPFVKDVDSTEL